jgi:hypothetical protein
VQWRCTIGWRPSLCPFHAGFFRLKYPHLVHASISSSSPWNAVVDMQVYEDIVGDSLAIESVGGSDECKATVVNGHQVGPVQRDDSSA